MARHQGPMMCPAILQRTLPAKQAVHHPCLINVIPACTVMKIQTQCLMTILEIPSALPGSHEERFHPEGKGTSYSLQGLDYDKRRAVKFNPVLQFVSLL